MNNHFLTIISFSRGTPTIVRAVHTNTKKILQGFFFLPCLLPTLFSGIFSQNGMLKTKKFAQAKPQIRALRRVHASTIYRFPNKRQIQCSTVNRVRQHLIRPAKQAFQRPRLTPRSFKGTIPATDHIPFQQRNTGTTGPYSTCGKAYWPQSGSKGPEGGGFSG